MNITRVQLKNFLSHKKTNIEFENGVTAVIGTNGSGKSSMIIDAVTWCLWGKSRISGAGDDLIHFDEEECNVAVEFLSGTKKYRVERTRKRGDKTTLNLSCIYDNGLVSTESGAVIKDTREKIDSLIGMSYDLFIRSCCIEQGHMDSFSTLTPAQAGRILGEVLKLDKYEVYREVAQGRLADTEKIMSELENKKELLNEKVVQAESVDSRIKSLQSNLDTAKKVQEAAQKTYDGAFDKFADYSTKIDKAVSRLNYLELEVESSNKQLSKLATQEASLEGANLKCPTCSSLLLGKKKESAKKQIKKQIKEVSEDKVKKEREVIAQNDELSSLNKSMKSDKADRASVDTAQKNLQTAKNKVLELESSIAAISENVEKVEDLKTGLREIETRIRNKELDKEAYTALVQAFGSKGIPLLIIDNTLRELQVLINDNLKLLCDLPISVELSTQREATSGKTVDTFQILIRNGLVARPYYNYSGGEKTLIDLSIRLGLSELLARRNNFKLETLVIDEGLGALDDNNQRNFVDTLIKLSSKLKKIIVITHTSAKEYFDRRLEVTKKDGISNVTLCV